MKSVNQIRYIVDGRAGGTETDRETLITRSLSEIQERLGTEATAEDAANFALLWEVHFLNCTALGFDDGLPVFYDDEDFDSSWAEIAAYVTLPYISPYDRRYLHLGGDPAQVFTDPDHLRMWQEMTEKEKEIADTDTEAQ